MELSRWLQGFIRTDSPQSAARRRGRFPLRLAIYAAVLLGLLWFRVLPSMRSGPPAAVFSPEDKSLGISGTGLAPKLIESLLAEYASDYPDIAVDARAGGTTQALEDLVNRRTDVAFLARPPSEDESRIIRERGDSVATYPIALGGIAVLASSRSAPESIDTESLRRTLGGESTTRVYVPEPNRGLWDAAASLLKLDAAAPPNVAWVESEERVVEAVSADAAALGLASTLALGDSLEARGVRFVPIRGVPEGPAFTANPQSVAAGEYPLFHYLYVSCRPGSGALASGFVTYLFSGRGQRLVSRSGFLPAREVPRLIQLASRPIGGEGT